jgi:hypothetical protein
MRRHRGYRLAKTAHESMVHSEREGCSPEEASASEPRPRRAWVRGEICRRDGIDYELIAVGEIESIEISRSKKHAVHRPRMQPERR